MSTKAQHTSKIAVKYINLVDRVGSPASKPILVPVIRKVK